MRILIVDDDDLIIEFIHICLADEFPDAEIVDYPSLQLGRPDADFDWGSYDLLLLDYNLGNGETGVDWLDRFGDQPRFPKTIFITAVDDPYIVANAVRCGADAYLNKVDLTPERLIAAAREVLASSPAEQPSTDDWTDSPLTGDTWVEDFEREQASSKGATGASYRFASLIGRGAMSSVHLAERIDDGLTVVLKILDRNLARDAEYVQRFILEAELVAGLDSPYVVKIYDHGFTNNYGYIAMEFFGRGDLKQRIGQGISPPDALAYLYNIVCGLEAIHGIGVVHRDLKPANIMFRSDGSLALADFGISKRLGSELELTTVGSIVGTPHYMSPEQARSQPVDQRADIYSTGVIFHEMLTGLPPYSGDTVSVVLFQHLHAAIPTLEGDHARFQPLLDRLMAKEVDERFGSATELKDMLASMREFV
jgi:serine/threonine protein kinase/CheY-like chemotaxis protein